MKVFEKTPYDLKQAADIIRGGGVILWPSCGVYGLACDAQDQQAVERIYLIKTRERNKPLPVIANRLTASRYGDLSDLAKGLIQRYWSGFLGIIVRKKPAIPDFVTAGDQSVALVCPNELAAELAHMADGPIAATSANISGQVEVLDPSIAATQFEGQVDGIIKGPVLPGVINTLLDLTQVPPAIIREGSVPFEELRQLIPNIRTI